MNLKYGIKYLFNPLDGAHQVTYAFKGEKLDNGREKCRAALKTRPDLALRVENEIRAKLGVEPRKGPAAPPPAAAKPEKAEEDKKPAKK